VVATPLSQRTGYPAIGEAEIIAPRPTAAFLRFWDAYPAGRGDQVEALRIWNERLQNIDPSTLNALVKGVHAWTRSDEWTQENGRFIPNPAKFLREERWRSPPRINHYDFQDHEGEGDIEEARFNGMTLREIEEIKARERMEQKAA
jgi:hypothetical protein